MGTNQNLQNAAEQVHDRTSFVAFLFLLSEDKAAEDKIPTKPYSVGAKGWEHGSIPSYLQAAAACEQSMINRGNVDPNENPWRACANILFYGKTYE